MFDAIGAICSLEHIPAEVYDSDSEQKWNEEYDLLDMLAPQFSFLQMLSHYRNPSLPVYYIVHHVFQAT